MTETWRVKLVWHYEIPLGTPFIVKPLHPGYCLVSPEVVPELMTWPKKGAQWEIRVRDRYLELAEGPW